MYDLVIDVARYPEFLPWVAGVRVRSDKETEMVADLIVGFKAIKETFTSRVQKTRPTSVTVDYVDGPLKFLHNEWTFSDDGKQSCVVEFEVEFEFKSKIFEALAGQVFDRALAKMTSAFVARAEALYGIDPGMSSSNATSAA
jgi:coenzyme Q-binding protein COQ10